jgi:hypothetical protein
MLKNVHLVPMTWDDEVALLKRELARATQSLKAREQRNRALPPLVAVANDQEYSSAPAPRSRSTSPGSARTRS